MSPPPKDSFLNRKFPKSISPYTSANIKIPDINDIKVLFNPSNISFDNSTITILSICFLISFLSLCITQLMYSRMLKDYISSLNTDNKKEKE